MKYYIGLHHDSAPVNYNDGSSEKVRLRGRVKSLKDAVACYVEYVDYVDVVDGGKGVLVDSSVKGVYKKFQRALEDGVAHQRLARDDKVSFYALQNFLLATKLSPMKGGQHDRRNLSAPRGIHP